jgi:nicotinate-nucleotide adenylyltransferase
MGVETAVRRIGLYGGAFDPPHLAHLAMADAFVAQCQLDELRVLPTGQAWHKAHTTSPAHHRLAMTRLAFADRPWAVVDAREMQRTGPTYTIDTLLELKAETPASQLFLLIGQDQWQRFATWQRWREILDNATIVVASRAHSLSAISQNGSESMAATPSELLAKAPPPWRLHWQPLALSSTQIRAALRMVDAPSPDPLVCVPPRVARYISQQQLY